MRQVLLSVDDWVCFFVVVVFCLDEASCMVRYWWLGDASSCIEMVFFV